MIAHRRSKKFDPEEDETAYFETAFKMCRRCKQEYTGACPINSAACPMEAEERGAEEEEEDEQSDFDDVADVDEVTDKDEEADRAAEDGDEIPEEDLDDDD